MGDRAWSTCKKSGPHKKARSLLCPLRNLSARRLYLARRKSNCAPGAPTTIGDYPVGAIVGVARLVRCATFTREGYERLRDQHCSDCDWTPGEYGWQFEDIRALPEPIPVRGYLGLFPVDEIIL